MDKLRTYLESFDGASDWSAVRPSFVALFHDDLVYVTPAGELSKDAFRGVAQRVLASGTKVTNVEIADMGDGIIHFGSTVTTADGTVTKSAAKGMLRDGRLVRVEPRAG